MFFHGLTEEQKLVAARNLFTQTLDVWNKWFLTMRRDFRFHSGGENQWDPEDLAVLKDQNRPALTFNLQQVVIPRDDRRARGCEAGSPCHARQGPKISFAR